MFSIQRVVVLIPLCAVAACGGPTSGAVKTDSSAEVTLKRADTLDKFNPLDPSVTRRARVEAVNGVKRFFQFAKEESDDTLFRNMSFVGLEGTFVVATQDGYDKPAYKWSWIFYDGTNETNVWST